MTKRALIFAIIGFCFTYLLAQPSKLGIPFIKNYTAEEYKADNQNWGIIQDKLGIMYFANNWGVLQFNGSDWRIIASVNNFSPIRSLSIDNKNKIYIGAFNEFGYLDYSQSYRSGYQSLMNKIPKKSRKFNDVWQIHQTSKGVYFQSSYSTYLYSNDTVIAIDFDQECQKSFSINDRIFLSFQSGLKELQGTDLVDMPDGNAFSQMNIAFMLSFGPEKILLGTEKNGLFIYDFKNLKPFSTGIDEQIRKNKLFCGIFTSDGSIALGTLHNGLFIIDKKGTPLLHLNNTNGLQNNTILSMRNDNLGNLWLTLDRGIDYVELASPFTHIRNEQIDGNIYSICKHRDNLYIATHHGLFYKSWDALNNSLAKIEDFNQVTGVSEINWNLTEIDGSLFLGHDNGAYIIENGNSEKISDIKGGWIFKKLEHYPHTIIEGTYKSFVLYRKQQNKWKLFKEFKIDESCRVVEEDQYGYIWITSGYTGVYRFKLNEIGDSIIESRLFKKEDGFPESIYFGVFKVNGDIVFGTQKGAYTFNYSTQKIEVYKPLFPYFKDQHIRKLQEDNTGNVWYIVAKNTGYLKLNTDGSYTQVNTPFQKVMDKQLPGFENMTIIDNQVLMGTKAGIINYNQSFKRDFYAPFQTILDRVTLTNLSDSLNEIPGAIIDNQQEKMEVPYRGNAMRFKFAASFYENTEEIQYSYILDGFDEEWSTWATKNEKEYTNIPEGTYTFRVKSKNIYGFEGAEASIKITILPPWYRTSWAYFIYFLLAIFVFWLIIYIKNQQFNKEKLILEEEKEKAMKLQLTEHMQEKLHDELKNKNKELASITMSLVQKNDTIIKIRDKFVSILGMLPESEQKKLKSLEQLIDDEINDDSYWEQYENHFNQIHDDFIKRFKMEHTSLTHRDLKMCAYLRMNLSNKEIASLLNITLRGVEASRLRLRRKLNLDKDILLTEYILRY